MKLFFTTMIMFFSVVVSADDTITGSWHGQLNVQGSSITLSFHIKSQETILTTVIGSPDQGVFGVITEEKPYKNNKLEISVPDIGARF